MGAKSERRGLAFGNARGSERQRSRRQQRLSTPRVASALEEVRAHQAQIDALVAAGDPLPRPTLVYKKPDLPPIDETRTAPAVVEKRKEEAAQLIIDWCIRDVYHLLHQGYTVKYTVKRTGYDHEVVYAIWEEIIDAWCDEEVEWDNGEDEQD